MCAATPRGGSSALGENGLGGLRGRRPFFGVCFSMKDGVAVVAASSAADGRSLLGGGLRTLPLDMPPDATASRADTIQGGATRSRSACAFTRSSLSSRDPSQRPRRLRAFSRRQRSRCRRHPTADDFAPAQFAQRNAAATESNGPHTRDRANAIARVFLHAPPPRRSRPRPAGQSRTQALFVSLRSTRAAHARVRAARNWVRSGDRRQAGRAGLACARPVFSFVRAADLSPSRTWCGSASAFIIPTV